mgnify:FL=1|tara:strand:+ start:1150 stop:1488 length:339 start_codon:yes stop_codon:yes gene_type:complete
MAFMNYGGSLRYDMNGRKRKAYKKNNPTKRRTKAPVRTIPASELVKKERAVKSTTEHIPSAPMTKTGGGGTGVDVEWQKEKLKISSGYTVAPAYNKGAYQVIGKNNIKDIGK